MGVLSLLFRVIMFLFRTLQSWLNPVREEPHPQPQQTDHESSSSSSSSSGSCYDWEEDEASSSSIPPSRYDVFLSFRGLDTRNTFTGHLYNRLDQVGIATFMDERELKEGEEIGPNLLKAIEESRISITIFSPNYASSKWCLDELVHIMECRERSKQQLVLPVFFNVDPRDVRKQKGCFGEAFEKLAAETDDREKVKRWKKALKKAGELKGWHLQNGHEAKLINEIVGSVSRELENITLPKAKNLVGIESSVEDMKRLLNVEPRGVRIVGICGMGGVGKTTLAEVVFNQISCNFEGGSFLGDVREVSKESRGLVSLQKQLLSDILKREIQSISSVTRGKDLIKKGLERKKVIIVLDDVDTMEQLEALAEECDWFGDGSRLIITTRYKHVLNTHKVHEIYKLKELDFGSSLQLFSKHAFGKDYPPKDHENLAKDVARTAGGLPLALKVLGSFLNDKDIPKEWISFLESLKKIHPHDIMKKLKISYDGLNKEEREIFLDIACFFIGTDKEEAIYIWKGSGFSPEIAIRNLIDKSLIYINIENKLRMHDQLRDMAMQIIRQEQLDEPGERSRLWLHDEVLNVLKHFAGTEKVKGLLLKLEEQATASEENCIYTEAFTAMSKLRLLCIDNANLAGSFKHFPSELRWFSWKRCPLECLPTDFHLEKLVVLDLSYSKITQVWNGPHQNKTLANVKVLKLGNCPKLTEITDFSRLPNLSNLTLDGNDFYSLPDLSNLKNLQMLDLSYCEKLVNIQGLKGLESLEYLYMNGCISVESLPEFPNFNEIFNLELGNCEKLVDIQGVEKLGSCTYLNLSGCSRIPADTLRKCIVYTGIQSPYKEILLSFPGNKIPDWFTPLEIRESYEEKIIRMVGPDRHSNGEQQHQKKMMEILLCFVFFNPREEDFSSNISVNGDRYLSSVINIGKMNGDQICLLRFKLGQFEERDEISFILKPSRWGGKDLPIVKKAGKHVLYYEKDEEEEESDDNNYTTTVQSAYERIADFFFPLNDDDDGGYGESNSSSSHRKRNNSHLLSDAREGGYFFAGKSKRQKKKE